MTEPQSITTHYSVTRQQQPVDVAWDSLASGRSSMSMIIEESLSTAGRQWAISDSRAVLWRETQTSPELIEASWRERRQHSAGLVRKYARDHLAHYAQQLSEMSERNSTRAVTDMLTELSEIHGVAWSDIAAALGISVPALRKWRKSTSGTTPENHLKLARLTAFFTLLARHVDSPARWMSMPFVERFNVTPADVYSPDHAEHLLDLAAGNAGTNPEGVLDAISTGWRDSWRSEYDVFEAADGQMSMRPRQTTV